jgi:hypothetical protein
MYRIEDITNKILQGNALDELKKFPDECIDMCMTSPPYWALRNYSEETNIVWDEDKNCEHEWNIIEKKPIGGKGSKGANVGSNNRFKLKIKLKKEYEKIINKKKDCRNKFVSNIIKENDIICIQNEQIHNWHKSKMKGFGRKIQHSIMGGIISDLKKKSETVIIDRFFPSTKLCPSCGKLNKLELSNREYICECGYSEDRDIHSAINILNQGLKQIGREPINIMLPEKISDLDKTFVFDKQFLMKEEAKCL